MPCPDIDGCGHARLNNNGLSRVSGVSLGERSFVDSNLHPIVGLLPRLGFFHQRVRADVGDLARQYAVDAVVEGIEFDGGRQKRVLVKVIGE